MFRQANYSMSAASSWCWWWWWWCWWSVDRQFLKMAALGLPGCWLGWTARSSWYYCVCHTTRVTNSNICNMGLALAMGGALHGHVHVGDQVRHQQDHDLLAHNCTQSVSWPSPAWSLPWQLIFLNWWNFFTATLSKTWQTWHFSPSFTKDKLIPGPSWMSVLCVKGSQLWWWYTRDQTMLSAGHHTREKLHIWVVMAVLCGHWPGQRGHTGHRKLRSGQANPGLCPAATSGRANTGYSW